MTTNRRIEVTTVTGDKVNSKTALMTEDDSKKLTDVLKEVLNEGDGGYVEFDTANGHIVISAQHIVSVAVVDIK